MERRRPWSTGNAYFTLTRTPLIDLRGKTHTLTIETLHTWCALHPHFDLLGPADGGPAAGGKR